MQEVGQGGDHGRWGTRARDDPPESAWQTKIQKSIDCPSGLVHDRDPDLQLMRICHW